MGDPRSQRPRRTVSAAHVARLAGVSPAAVSYVMNGVGGVSEETRRHILSIAQEVGYRPKPTGKRSPQRNRVIGLIMPNIVNPMYPRWAQGIITAASKTGHDVFVAISQDDPGLLHQTTKALVARNVDGVIIIAAHREDATALRTLRTAHIPYVQLSRKSDHVAADFVGIDDSGAADLMMRHMLDHGRTDIATVVGPRFSSASASREAGYLSAAERAGVRIPPEWRISTKINNVGGRMAAEELFSRRMSPLAILCGSDELAIGVMEYAVRRGIQIPQDISIAGFDGLPHSRSALINLTTIIQPQDDMAVAAFEILRDRLDDNRSHFRTAIFPHRLYVGGTCGCPEDEWGLADGS